MYRLKARKSNDSDWFPILVQPQIVSEYSQSIVTTLHQKNLLLLGEDRFLTTLLLRTFPNRKMMFCPQARCRTVAPDTFSVLLSQRRRWINSTIHNLMELVLVRSLCGSFCFSMQFILVVDLIGTVVLPIAICLTYTLIINYIFNPPSSFSDAIPLLLLGAVLGLPAVLILITTFKVGFLLPVFIFLVALLTRYYNDETDRLRWLDARLPHRSSHLEFCFASLCVSTNSSLHFFPFFSNVNLPRRPLESLSPSDSPSESTFPFLLFCPLCGC